MSYDENQEGTPTKFPENVKPAIVCVYPNGTSCFRCPNCDSLDINMVTDEKGIQICTDCFEPFLFPEVRYESW